ncbi:hypothetical protein Afil01_51300 [Actinorhabdospora filicis]|uniref:Uncharacterized protein n=1 Tax=Actinorhabdospora filicis TaxID=1785913 RepID=A0A9W6SQL9_9ACTN|nr:DUF6345 domain-containing protein [Actinorhabdospora filicis]GLZ80323.1 hypothetical protein Afil01_51300 [Actinorhabdospora filicis]
MKPLAHKHSPAKLGLAGLTAAILVASLAQTGQAAPTALTATVYSVVQEGLTVADGQRLADTFGIGNALYPNGAFSYADNDKFQYVPHKVVGSGKDEGGNATQDEAVDLDAVKAIKPLPDAQALARAQKLADIALKSEGLTLKPRVTHSTFTLSDDAGKVIGSYPIDTTVSFDAVLGNLPLAGQGASLRVTFAPDGTITELSESLRRLAAGRQVAIITADEAQRACAAVYGGAAQNTPVLSYLSPELSSRQADGKGTVTEVLPQYQCSPVDNSDGTQAPKTVPAITGGGPTFKVSLNRQGDTVSGAASVSGGTAPYTFRWGSSTTVLSSNTGQSVSYKRVPRDTAAKTETVSLEVTDANGLVASLSVPADTDGQFTGLSSPGGGSFALGTAGIENTVDEWQCAQDSANGFRNVMLSKGQTVAFDWRGYNAWEIDFRDPTVGGGWDNRYVDTVDIQWYTGHGSPYSFTFKSNVTDHNITPYDAKWGDTYNLEWLQLESCQVLRGVGSPYDFVSRWGRSFKGLHMMNGFHTNAYCVGGGTGGTFASYLFPIRWLWWTLRPAYTVQRAWATMAILKEPHGVVYRSFGPVARNWVTNINDYYWGQGPTGPDIQPTGIWWSITGTV